MSELVIVTGSSGFIGQQLVLDLLQTNYSVIGIDIKPCTNASINSNVLYKHLQIDLTEDLNTKLKIGVTNIYTKIYVCHLAAKIRVDESMTDPSTYYNYNVTATINLLNWCHHNNIYNFIFASTAAVYSTLNVTGYKEEEAGNPLSVYGRTKLICEQIINDYSTAYGFKGYIFRFFNVCGGSEKNHNQPIHLLPIIVNNLRNNKDISIYGTDYQTRDGTCLRDYIHLKDISSGFIKALQKGFDFNKFKIYNLGSGSGYTVREIVDNVIKIYTVLNTDPEVKIIDCPRRPGDFDTLLANSYKAIVELNWKPLFSLNQMITDTILSFK